MAKQRQINVEFYKVELPEGSPTDIEQIFKKIESLDLLSRCEEINGVPVRLETHTIYPSTIQGDIVKIRMDDLPHKACLNAPIEPLPLDENTGLGNGTAFLFDRQLRVLAIQRNQMGVLPSMWSKYFTYKADFDSMIQLQLLLHPDALKRLAKVETVRSFNVRIAAPGNASIFNDLGLAPSQIIDLMDASPRATIDITLSMANEHGSLPRQGILTRATAWVDTIFSREGKGERHKVEIRGRNELESPEVIDLIRDRLLAIVPLPKGTERTVPYERRKKAVEEAWKMSRPVLMEILGGEIKNGSENR